MSNFYLLNILAVQDGVEEYRKNLKEAFDGKEVLFWPPKKLFGLEKPLASLCYNFSQISANLVAYFLKFVSTMSLPKMITYLGNLKNNYMDRACFFSFLHRTGSSVSIPPSVCSSYYNSLQYQLKYIQSVKAKWLKCMRYCTWQICMHRQKLTTLSKV